MVRTVFDIALIVSFAHGVCSISSKSIKVDVPLAKIVKQVASENGSRIVFKASSAPPLLVWMKYQFPRSLCHWFLFGRKIHAEPLPVINYFQHRIAAPHAPFQEETEKRRLHGD